MFRLENFLIQSPTLIQLGFNTDVSESLGVANFSVYSNLENQPDLNIYSVEINGKVITLVTSPQFPLANYTLRLRSTAGQAFESASGEELPQDGTADRLLFLGIENENEVRERLLEQTPPVYDLETNSVVRQHISNLAEQIMRASVDVKTTAHGMLVSEVITDEIMQRGESARDRLTQESSYQVDRVALTASGAELTARTLTFDADNSTDLDPNHPELVNSQIDAFPSDPVSLQQVSITESVSNVERELNSFDDLLISVSKHNIVRVDSIVLVRDLDEFVYDVPSYGYGLQSNRYDTAHAFQNLALESNQIKLSLRAILEGDFPAPQATDTIRIVYSYKNLGINVDPSITIYTVLPVVREVAPALQTVFSLSGFPICDSAGDLLEFGGVTFLDPAPTAGDAPYSVDHPAFAEEIVFNRSAPPAEPGQFAIDYSTGQVMVFGSDASGFGTGTIPPVASYFYRRIYRENVDYVFDTETDELVAVAFRDLAGQEAIVEYFTEVVLVPGTDYIAEAHNESIQEYVENRFIDQSRILPQNIPVTDVFRIFNETTGEIYQTARFTDNVIYIAGENLPAIEDFINEPVEFVVVDQEDIFISDVVAIIGSDQIVSVELANDNVASGVNLFIADSTNTSVVFADQTLFVREFYWDDVLQDVSQNIGKLQQNGDYLIDANSGIVYLRCAQTTEFALGTCTYKIAKIATANENVIRVNDIRYAADNSSDALLKLDMESFGVGEVTPENVPSSLERFLLGNIETPILKGAIQYGVAGNWVQGTNTFSALDADFTPDMADGNHILRFVGDEDRLITGVTDSTTVTVDLPFTSREAGVSWILLNTDVDGYTTVTSYPIRSIRGVYLISDLQALPTESITNYWDHELDSFDGNVITFQGDAVGIPVGSALAIDYEYGPLFVDYTAITDNIVIDYEWGDNSLNFSQSNLGVGTEYYVTYRYGALRNDLLANFASLTQIDELIQATPDLPRETLRDLLLAALQTFPRGPTLGSFENIAQIPTLIKPDIRELTFNEWTVGRDNLYPDEPTLALTAEYGLGKWGSGLVFNEGQSISLPAERYITLSGGTFGVRVVPDWAGIDNDATLDIDVGTGVSAVEAEGLLIDGNLALSDIYIGVTGFHPTEMPFSISRKDVLSPVGQPVLFGDKPGVFVWFDEDQNRWFLKVASDSTLAERISGTITSSGQFHDVQDGYSLLVSDSDLEASDTITSTLSYIKFNVSIDSEDVADGYDGYGGDDGYNGVDGYYYVDSLSFQSDNLHYFFDTGPSLQHNRISLFKDGSGYLNLRVLDNLGSKQEGKIRSYAISTNIQDWSAGQDHSVFAAWKTGTPQANDELHLFVDGLEVANLYKWGGRPAVGTGVTYRQVAEEVIEASASAPVFSGTDGSSQAGGFTFESASGNFVARGVLIGHTLTIREQNADGVGSPYTITGVTATSLTLSSALLLDLDDISYTINSTDYTASTDVATETIAVYRIRGGEETELAGVDAVIPDYEVSRTAGTSTLTILNGVVAGDEIIIRTLGLTKGRAMFKLLNYVSGQYLYAKGGPPVDLNNFDVYRLLATRTSIEDGNEIELRTGSFTQTGDQIDGYFTGFDTPSNTVAGKQLRFTLHGTDNIDFTGLNRATIQGTSAGGPVSEQILFTDYGVFTSAQRWTSITQIDLTFAANDSTKPFGAIEIQEHISLTVSEAGGTRAALQAYDNGRFDFRQAGTLTPYTLSKSYYLLDYPLRLTINLDAKGLLKVGSDLNGENSLGGVMVRPYFLNEVLDDVRAGEDKHRTRTVTSDHNSPVPIQATPQTTMLLDLNGQVRNIAGHYRIFDERFRTTSSSVNVEFGDALVLTDGIVLDNGRELINPRRGTIEFMVSPLIDTYNDFEDTRFLVDITAATLVEVESLTKTTIILPNRARKINRIYRLGDRDRTNLFVNGRLLPDGKTVKLAAPLPRQSTTVVVDYNPIDFAGDRISIYRDGYGTLSFAVTADDELFKISHQINWKRGTWHRIMATWDLGNANNADSMRFFVDGIEESIVTWGTPGLIWGGGHIWGTALTGTEGAQALVADIDISDDFSQIYLGTSYARVDNYPCLIDNLRFSSTARQPVRVGSVYRDLNFNSNTEAMLPVVEDAFTREVFDFTRGDTETEFLANVLSKSTALFTIGVTIDDGFTKIIDNAVAKNILQKLYERLKPAHTNILTSFIQDEE